MKYSASRLSFVIRIMLLMICCALFMPQNLHASQKQSMDPGIRMATMTLAITAAADPSSQLQNLSSSDRTALRGQGQRGGFASSGQRTSISSPGKRSHQEWFCLDDASPATLPGTPPLPSFFPCTKALFSFCALLPESHGHIHWFALAPPASRNV
jgi:hypothetical protein